MKLNFTSIITHTIKCGGMMKLVNMLDSKSSAAMLLGSSPSTSTNRFTGVNL